MIGTIIAWLLSHLDWLPWAAAGVASLAAAFFKALAGKHKADAKAATKRLDTIDQVERIRDDAEKMSDSNLAKSLTRGGKL